MDHTMRTEIEASKPRRGLLAVMAVVCLTIYLFEMERPAVAQSEGDWGIFQTLIGTWIGEGAGFGDVSDITHEWSPVVSGQFLRLQTRSVQRQGGEVHEDIGLLSRDRETDSFVFRQFLSEGYVVTYDVGVEKAGEPAGSPEGSLIVFRFREAESTGGMQARMRLTFVGNDQYEMVLELAAPGGEFAPCQQMHFSKVP